MTEQAPIPAGVKRLLAALMAGTIAFSVMATTIGLQVYEINESEFDLGLVGIVQFLPVLILSSITGTIADRFDRRRVFAVGLLINMAGAAGLLAYAATNPTNVVPILALLAFYGIGRSVGTPAARALPIDLAPEGSLERIVAVRSLTFQVALIIGPVIAGLLNKISHVLPYIVVLSAQALAVLLLQGVPKPSTDKLESAPGPRQVIADAVEGFRFIRHSPIILGAISLDLFAVLFGGAVALLPAIVDKRLGIDDVDLGVAILQASIAAAAATTALVLSMRPLTRRAGSRLFVTIAIFGLATVVLGITRNYIVAMFAVAALSAADQVSVFIRATVVPLATPESMRGRVLAVENVFIGGSNQLGAFESGATAALFGLAPAVVIGGVGTLAVVAGGWFLFPDLRNVDRFSDVRPQPTGAAPT